MKIYEELSDEHKTWMKKGALLFAALLNAFLVLLIVSYGTAVWKEIKTIRGPKLQISLQGEGKVAAKPDVLKLTATVLTEGASLIDAQKVNTERSNAVTDFLKNSGVAEKDVKTVGYNIYPQYSYPRPCRVLPCLEDETPKIVGYQIRNTLAITIRDIAKAGDILSGVVEAGANEVSGLEFAIDEPDALKAEAREKAIDDARAKAERLAEGLGKRVGKIVAFSESGFFPGPIPFAVEAFGKGGGGVAPSPEIQPGENEITVNVSVTYEFK